MRLREYSESVPKPMVPIGYRPILWHVMKYYAHFGHKDFILCLGYRADVIKEYFLQLRRVPSRTTSCCPEGGRTSSCSNSDIQDWTHHVRRHRASTRNIGQRLKAVRAVPRAARRCSWPTTATA